MEHLRRYPSESLVDRTLTVGAINQIVAAHHVRYRLIVIVDNNRELVRCRTEHCYKCHSADAAAKGELKGGHKRTRNQKATFGITQTDRLLLQPTQSRFARAATINRSIENPIASVRLLLDQLLLLLVLHRSNDQLPYRNANGQYNQPNDSSKNYFAFGHDGYERRFRRSVGPGPANAGADLHVG